MIRFSRVKKLDGIRSWSLPAGDSCPGSYKPDGSLIDPCKGCYAKGGNYHRPNVKQPRQENMVDWRRSDWVADMVKHLDHDRYFRWFDSGDVYHPELALKILKVMELTWWVKHWLPTQSHTLPRIRTTLDKMSGLSNVRVRYSSDSINGEYEDEHGSVIIPTPETTDDTLTVCMAYANKDGVCDFCRKCWDKEVGIIAYPAHGSAMLRLIAKG